MDIKSKYLAAFEANHKQLFHKTDDAIKDIKQGAYDYFVEEGFPSKKIEHWKYTKIEDKIGDDFVFELNPPMQEYNLAEIFTCDVPDVSEEVIYMINGWYAGKQTDRLKTLANGCVIGSFAAAIKAYPELIKGHYAHFSKEQLKDGMEALNTVFAQDGFFIYAPDHVIAKEPIQIINIINHPDDLLIHQRNLIVAGKNSQVKVVVCDHSLFFNKSFTNSVTEVDAQENSHVEVYRLQNSSNNTATYNYTNIHQQANSQVKSNILTLHGGFIRNDIHVNLNGENGHVDLLGLYICDRTQHIDNHTIINHKAPHCSSNEKYKGILDDESLAIFNGLAYVARDAQKTDAKQTNNNILLNPSARVRSRPQLEIYADDVKCSHGSTVGQLDDNAMFYLRSRGIEYKEARMMLMYAFAAEIVNEIAIDSLKNRMNDLIEKRLRGEMSRCNHCKITCS